MVMQEKKQRISGVLKWARKVGSSLWLHLDECINEIKDNLANRHMMKEMKMVGNYRAEVFPSLCSTPKKNHFFLHLPL